MSDKSNKFKTLGLVTTSLFGVVSIGLLIGTFPFILPALRKICLPYIPATEKQIQNVTSLLKRKKGKVIDLGSGDGRIVLSAAKLGYSAYGVELNPWLVLYSRIKATYLGLNTLATFKKQDIWKTNLRDFDIVIIFGVEQMMLLLEEKLAHELKDKSCIIACRFPLPNWKSSLTIKDGIDTVWLYEKKSSL